MQRDKVKPFAAKDFQYVRCELHTRTPTVATAENPAEVMSRSKHFVHRVQHRLMSDVAVNGWVKIGMSEAERKDKFFEQPDVLEKTDPATFWNSIVEQLTNVEKTFGLDLKESDMENLLSWLKLMTAETFFLVTNVDKICRALSPTSPSTSSPAPRE